MPLINKKACRNLLQENKARAKREFWTALDAKVAFLIRRAIRRANRHMITPLDLMEVSEWEK